MRDNVLFTGYVVVDADGKARSPVTHREIATRDCEHRNSIPRDGGGAVIDPDARLPFRVVGVAVVALFRESVESSHA